MNSSDFFQAKRQTTNIDQLRRFGYVLILGALLIFFGMVVGGVSRSGIQFAGLEVLHQSLVALGGGAILIGAVIAYRQISSIKPLLNFIITGAIFYLLEAGIGQVIRLGQGDAYITGIHYAFSVIVLSIVSASAGLIFFADPTIDKPISLKYSSRFSRQAAGAVIMVMALLVSGAWLAASGNQSACAGWPLCGQTLIPDGKALVPFLHRGFVLAVGIYLYRFASRAWTEHRSQKIILTASNSLMVLFIAQGFIGALISLRAATRSLVVLHELSAAMLVVVSGLLLVTLGLKRSDDSELSVVELPPGRTQRIEDFLALNKPVVVLLLLATTFAGMVMGAKGLPPTPIVVVTLIAGALAAGGSGAINQFIDRDIDAQMARTSRRPIPGGRLTPAEGLAFGVSALLVSFYLMAGLVNMLAALLSLVGMVYYVFLYSIVLKRRSVQNIVIGGGAGAIPPLVGWAAATGSLNLTAVFLFLIIFLWTPPHFWALALTRKNEYAGAGVPMMPAEKGEDVTRKLVLQYSIGLVALTLLMPFLGLAGWVYLIGAVLLGGYLLWLAWQVWKVGRNRVYYKMYRHSNYYLLLIFIVLAIDSILL